MRIAIDGRAMGLLVGKGVYSKSVAQAWATIGQAHYFTVYGYAPPAAESWPANFTFTPLPSLGRRVQAFRTLTEDVLFSPASYLTTIVANKPTLTTVHDLVIYKAPVKLPLKTRLAERFLLGAAIRASDRLTVQTEATKQDLVELFPAASTKTVVVGPGVTPGVSRELLPDTAGQQGLLGRYGLSEYLLSVGTLEPRKNIVRLVAAYTALPEEVRQRYKLVLAGRLGWADAALERLVARPPAGVVVTGRIDEATLTTLYANATAVVYPSLYEGVGYPVLEGYYWHKPVVTSNLSSMQEIGQEAALLVDPYSVDSIRAGVLAVLTEPTTAASLAAAGAAKVAGYSWSSTARSYLEILETIA